MSLMLMSIGYSQDLKIKEVPLSTLKNIDRQIKKCDSLRERYNEAMFELTRLQNEIENSTNKIKELDNDKKLLKDELKEIEVDFKTVERKRYNFSVQFGMQPIFVDNDFSVRPYFGFGVGYTIFRF